MRTSLVLAACLVTAAVGCSPADPHIGATSNEAQVAPGVSMKTTDNRYMLPSGKIAGSEGAMINMVANVTKIDRANRLITLTSLDGDHQTLVKAGPQVRNFNLIKPGDRVQVQYAVSVAFETREPTSAELAANDTTGLVTGRAPVGGTPAGLVAANTVKVVTIESIDKDAQVVVMKDMQGNLSTVRAKYPENLSYVKPGDKVVVTVSEALAAQVTPVS